MYIVIHGHILPSCACFIDQFQVGMRIFGAPNLGALCEICTGSPASRPIWMASATAFQDGLPLAADMRGIETLVPGSHPGTGR